MMIGIGEETMVVIWKCLVRLLDRGPILSALTNLVSAVHRLLQNPR